ncbi:hypothetical protein QJS04_geneDACA013070 [Acorus gramineus]|uniref:Uncharacterized protein n=1 Tax=Acorus gramineus TaxID=55184 RepID=A0AAV9B619_ACOGR|nr:hypothetical protein QJS04_geneDACA013070 [Acorus gramineus]
MSTSKRPPILADDVPWRKHPSGSKPIPKIHQNPLLRVQQTPSSDYGLAVMKHRDPISEGLAFEAKLEPAGPDCIVPGQVKPVRLLGLKFLDSAVNLMNASFQDR